MSSMRRLAVAIALALVAGAAAGARAADDDPEPPPGLLGKPLRDWLRTTFFTGKHEPLGYREAREVMFAFIDNDEGEVVCVYGGWVEEHAEGKRTTTAGKMNTEHTVPASLFRKRWPMRSDLHHLFPTYAKLNELRANFRFAEIPDDETDIWAIRAAREAELPDDEHRDRYSELDQDGERPHFEPPEAHKGNVARAVFYFFTVYPDAGKIEDVADVATLLEWHVADPIDDRERARDLAIEKHQGNRNPFVIEATWAARAWSKR